MIQTEKPILNQEMKAVIDALNNSGLEYNVEGDTIMIKAIQKKESPIHYPIPISEFQQNNTIIKIENLFSYTALVIKTPNKEYRIPIGREGYMIMYYIKPYLKIIFRNFDRSLIPEFQRQEMEKVIKFLSEGGIKFEVIDYRIWIEGTPMYIDPYRIIIRQGEDDIEFDRYTTDTKLVHRKGNIDRDLWYLKTITAHYAYPYLILMSYRSY